ncbi:10372_t:CDS:10 [Ambispora leptoticha]|uniref:10372_t:CDS:1 n=1 Tax=Ambispora leptoticha TaxID=144679 RepID=A0A9N8VA84_9GLOM|nr:10372_t:CDS:10 [Ambispora leptoticha]
MEWNSTQELVSNWNPSASCSEKPNIFTCQTVDIVKNVDKINKFLEMLLEQITACADVHECATKFSPGVRVLGEFVPNKILLLHPKTFDLIVKCIIGYVKIFDLESEFLTELKKPIDWCIRAFRSITKCKNVNISKDIVELIEYYCQTGSIERNNYLIKESVATITQCLDNLELFSVRPSVSCLKNLSEQCIPLLNDISHSNLVDRIIRAAINNNPADSLSDFFVEHLVFFKPEFYQKLSESSKIGLCNNFPFVVEYEVLTLFGQLLFPSNKYRSPPIIRNYYKDAQLFRIMSISPIIFNTCFNVLLSLIDETRDLRILRLARYFIESFFEDTLKENGIIELYVFKPLDKLVSILCDEIQDSEAFSYLNIVRKELLLEGLPSDYELRRKQVWLLLLAFSKWRHWIIEAIFDQEKYPEIAQLEAPLDNLTWLVCPLDDAVILNLKNVIADIIMSLRESINLHKGQTESILSILNQHEKIFKDNPLLTDITLGLWPIMDSLPLMQTIAMFFVSSTSQDKGKGTDMSHSANISLSSFTIILDYFHEIILPTKNGKKEAVREFLKNLEHIYESVLT